MNLATWILAVLISALASLGGGYWYGKADGRAEERARQDSKTVKDLGEIISSQTKLIQDANAASSAMRQATARREAADRKTTEEFNHALAATADSRAGCVFDAGVLRQLAAARDRAAQAAAGGIRGTLPAPGASADTP